MIKTLKGKVKNALRPTYHSFKRLFKRPASNTSINKLVFYFSGREYVWPGMGKELYNTEPVFKQIIQQCNAVITGLGLNEIISYFEGPIVEDYFEIEKNYMCVCAIQMATYKTILSKGIYPDAILGVSMGELAALYATGANSLEDSITILANWLKISETEKMDHSIVSIGIGFEKAKKMLKEFPAPTTVLFEVNENHSIMSLPYNSLNDLNAFFTAREIFSKAYDKSFFPYHTPLMEPFKQQYKGVYKKTLSKPLICDYYSPALPGVLKKNTFADSNYWHRVLSEPVFLNTILKQVVSDGYNTALQLGLPGLNKSILTNINIGTISSFTPDIGEVENFQAVCKSLVKQKYDTSPFNGINEAKRLALFKEDFDLLTVNPPAAFEYLRKAGDVHYIPKQDTWLVLSYDLVDSVFKQPHLFSSSIFNNEDSVLLGAEPEAHNIIRDLIQPMFSPAAINKLVSGFKTEAVKLVDELLFKDEFDFLTDVSSTLTQSALHSFWGFTEAESLMMNDVLGTDIYNQQYVENTTAFFDNLLELSNSSNDTIPGRIKSFIDSKIITHDEAVSLARILWLAGTHTSVTFNAAVFNKLMDDPDMATELKDNEKLVPIFVGECLRLMPAINFLSRITTEPVELGGVKIPANAKVTLSIESANSDPAHFTDPAEFSITRPAKRNLSFGAGIHQCIGMGIGRAEAIALTNVVLERLDDFKKYKIREPQYFQFKDSKIITSLYLKKIDPN